jgi:hypothetical protein
VQRAGVLGLARVDEGELLGGAVLHAGEPGSGQLAHVSSFPRALPPQTVRRRCISLAGACEPNGGQVLAIMSVFQRAYRFCWSTGGGS